jgi:hypothetical protein
MKTKKKTQSLSAQEIDAIVVAQANNDSAWERPIRVHKTAPALIPRKKRGTTGHGDN